jgi:hypothetical protein
MRYFISLGVDNKAISLYRLDVQEEAIVEERWTGQEWVNNPDDDIAQYVLLGEGEFIEAIKDVAMEIYPAAFEVADIAKGQYEVTKQTGEQKYTLGAMYIPNRVDAHGEWTDAEELQNAVWQYVRSGNRDIRLQHDRDIVAGEWVEVMQLPYPLETPVVRPDGVEETHTYPAGTVFLGVIWKDWAWELVKMGKILGYSIGGKAERMFVDMEKDMTVNDVHVDTIMTPAKKKPKKVKDEAK